MTQVQLQPWSSGDGIVKLSIFFSRGRTLPVVSQTAHPFTYIVTQFRDSDLPVAVSVCATRLERLEYRESKDAVVPVTVFKSVFSARSCGDDKRAGSMS